MKTVLVTLGTRPEAIKLAPVVAALRKRTTLRVRTLFTGQHRALLDQVAAYFDITPDADLRVMRPDQTLAALTARLVEGLDASLEAECPDVVLAQGDTTTVLATSLACYYRKIPFGHVEAGLRTDDLFSPFPEEGNRRIVSMLAAHHFAPTEESAANLAREGVPPSAIHVTGNTVVDAVLEVAKRDVPLPIALRANQRLITVTLHRRESFGEPLRDVLGAIRTILEARPDVVAVYPVHLNPNVDVPAHEMLGGVSNCHLIPPVSYGEMVALMKRSVLIMTDSGGVQEEAPSLGVPVIVLRDTTERPEGVRTGCARLCGTNPENIVSTVLELLDSPQSRHRMRVGTNPYGDGRASARIADVIEDAYGH
jgi:UDP-N-acetylglucosamine 2-epimerase (non-hydrolysing)